MANDVNISGGEELFKALQDFPALLEQKIMRGAMRAGTSVMLHKAQEIVPRAPPSGSNAKRYSAAMGDLMRSLRVRTVARGGKVSATLVAGDKKAYYAHMVEFGTVAHHIAPKWAKALGFGAAELAGVDHPGARANPFMRITLDSQAAPAVQAVADYVAKRIDKETAKSLANLPDEQDSVTR